MIVKPFFKTLLLSSLIFGLIVIFGMKYHWVDYLKSEDKENIELTLPQHSVPKLLPQDGVADKNDFQLEIVRSERPPITAKMTKAQIIAGCQQLYRKMGMQKNEFIDVLIGDCVVSNYQKAIQNTSQFTTVEKEQQQLLIKKVCHQKVSKHTHLSSIDKQLLLGVCVSDGINQLD